MCSQQRITPSTRGSWEQSAKLERLQEALRAADAVVIGAGAGLSTSAGYTYSGERFQQLFPDFIAAYQFSNMYEAGFYPYRTPEETWGFWSRYIYYNRYVPIPKPVYQQLLQLVEGKEYFVLTTNVDHCFQRAGFAKERLFYTPGIIKYPFWRLTKDNPQAVYACLNYGQAGAPTEIAQQVICINGDVGDVLGALKS